METKTTLEILPGDCLGYGVFTCLSFEELKELRPVSKNFNKLVIKVLGNKSACYNVNSNNYVDFIEISKTFPIQELHIDKKFNIDRLIKLIEENKKVDKKQPEKKDGPPGLINIDTLEKSKSSSNAMPSLFAPNDKKSKKDNITNAEETEESFIQDLLIRVKKIDLSGNEYIGVDSIRSLFMRFKNIENLNIKECFEEGGMKEVIESLKKAEIKKLNLSGNCIMSIREKISHHDYTSFFEATEELNLSFCNFLPPLFEFLKNVKVLNLMGIDVSEERFLKEFYHLSNVEELTIGFDGKCMMNVMKVALLKIKKLRKLIIVESEFGGKFSVYDIIIKSPGKIPSVDLEEQLGGIKIPETLKEIVFKKKSVRMDREFDVKRYIVARKENKQTTRSFR